MSDFLNSKPASRDLNVESRRIEALRPNPKNARTHSRSQIKAIAQSINQFGFINPILVDDDGMILAGHGRFEAAKLLGLAEVPCIRIGELNEAEKRAYVLADNKLAERAGWDRELLAIELGELSVMLPDIGLSIELTGFEIGEIQAIKPKTRKSRAAITVPVEDEVNPPSIPVTRPGDIWTLGRHRIVCGDPRRREVFAALLGDERADLVFTDLPSNVPPEDRISTRALEGGCPAQSTEIAADRGEQSETGVRVFLRDVLGHAASVSRSGAAHHVSTSWWHVVDVIEAGRSVYGAPTGMCAWTDDKSDKRRSGGAVYELMVMFPVKCANLAEQVDLAQPRIHQIQLERLHPLASGMTSKSVAAVAGVLGDIADRDALVLDPFGARGTTLLAAEHTGQRARLIALDPGDVDATVLRYQALTGSDPIHEDTGATFAAIARARTERSAVAARETDND
jgi:hypothetical protein